MTMLILAEVKDASEIQGVAEYVHASLLVVCSLVVLHPDAEISLAGEQ
ncbi:MAG: hypothetical protein O7D30_06390 [Rickettsia endosymbiont of Ixodes persulcatus]|nr:hypothetical protein [Rickettsia endosymbiont of Ixodes persulcatus]